MRVYRQLGLRSVEYGRCLWGERVVVEDQPDHRVLQELGFGTGDRVHQQVYAHAVADQVLAEARVAGDQRGLALVVDAIPESGLDLVSVIDFESGYTNATALVDHAIRCEFLYHDRGAGRSELLIGDTDAHVRRIGLFQIAHQLLGAGRADHSECLRPRTASRQPAREPDIRDAAHMVGVVVRDEERVEARYRDPHLRQPDRYAASRIKQELLVPRLDKRRRPESIDPGRWRTGAQQGHTEKVLRVGVQLKERRAGENHGCGDPCSHRVPPADRGMS